MAGNSFNKRPISMRYITRKELKYSDGWQVHIGQTRPQRVSKFFGDVRHGGKRKALKKAKRFRDKMLKFLFKSDGMRRLSPCMHQHQKHGLPTGVSYKRYLVRMANKRPRWVETFYGHYYDGASGKWFQKSFSIYKHGYKRAKQMAIAWRKQYEKS